VGAGRRRAAHPVPAHSLDQHAAAADGGVDQRVTGRAFEARVNQAPYAATDYRLLQTNEDRRATATGPVLARTRTSYDAAGLPVETDVYTSITIFISSASRTMRTFDPRPATC